MGKQGSHELLNHLLDAHEKSYDTKDPVRHEHKIKAEHPKYIIVATGIFDDVHNGYKNSGLCYTFKTSIYRMHEDNAHHNEKLAHPGKLIKRDVIVCIPCGRWGASIQSHMSESVVIPTISIIRVQHTKDSDHTIQKTDYNICKIMTFDQVDDKMLFSFTYETKTDDFTDYTKDGNKKGHIAYTVKSDEAHNGKK